MQNLDAFSQEIYDTAREISLQEAISNKAEPARREQLIARIKDVTRKENLKLDPALAR